MQTAIATILVAIAGLRALRTFTALVVRTAGGVVAGDVTAVLLPVSVYHLGLKRYAPARQLIDAGAIDIAALQSLKDDVKKEADEAVVQTMKEAEPTREDVYVDTYAPSEVDAVYPKDFTGLPGIK